jgi:hypothetical protein
VTDPASSPRTRPELIAALSALSPVRHLTTNAARHAATSTLISMWREPAVPRPGVEGLTRELAIRADRHFADTAVPPAYAEVAALEFPACWLDQLLRMLRIEPVKMKSSASAMAHRLSIHLRTLNRQLKAQGMKFRTLADAVRFAVAR